MSSLGFYPVYNPPVPEALCAGHGETLALAFNALDDLAEANGLPPLTQFADNREIPEDFDESPEDLEDLLEPWEEWFECEEGMEVFGGIARLLRGHGEAARQIENAEALARELDDWVRALAIARRKGARFRLELG
jgi:hypothetical protein